MRDMFDLQRDLSVCIITKNEEKKLPACLKSVARASEVVVVDDFSADRTPEICRSFANVRYLPHAFEGFGAQKRFAVSQCRHDWVLNLDADEEMTPGLEDEIARVLSRPAPCAGYSLRRSNLLFGRFHLDNLPGALRLFRKSLADFDSSHVHERVEIAGPVGQLQGHIMHRPRSGESYRGYYDVHVRRYGLLAARDYAARGVKVTWCNWFWKLLMVPLLVFIRDYILKRKFLLGFAGFFASFCGALSYHTAYRHLWSLQKEEA